jgi:hypothetical protein
MALPAYFMLGSLVTLPVLVAQWVGILGLRHIEKSGAWWSMAVGVVLSTAGLVINIASRFFLHVVFGSSDSLFVILASIPALGSLLFAIGFAMHGLKASRSASRMLELEQLTAAMSEEINQLRDKASRTT